jgi:hypothetical protein
MFERGKGVCEKVKYNHVINCVVGKREIERDIKINMRVDKKLL